MAETREEEGSMSLPRRSRAPLSGYALRKQRRRTIIVNIDGKFTVHAEGANGNYDTLCGIDANDPRIGHLGAEESDARINCESCIQILRQAWLYRPSDLRKGATP